MSYPARDPRSGIDGQAIAIVAEPMRAILACTVLR